MIIMCHGNLVVATAFYWLFGYRSFDFFCLFWVCSLAVLTSSQMVKSCLVDSPGTQGGASFLGDPGCSFVHLDQFTASSLGLSAGLGI